MNLPKPDFKEVVNNDDGYNGDIIEAIHANFPAACRQVKGFAEKFRGSNARETAHNIWKFLKKNVQYKKDNSDNQLIRLPSRFIYGNGVTGEGDCKSYSLTSAALFHNVHPRLPIAFRYAAYNGTTTPTHVYTVAKDEEGKEIIFDGVYSFFDSEKPPTYKKDYQMRIATLSGTDIDGIGKRHRTKKHRLAKYGLAAPRRAFRTLVAGNVRGLATHFDEAIRKDPNRIKTWWEKLGGKFSALQHSVNAGKKRKRILGIDGIGSPFLAIMAAAAPVLVAAAAVLKALGVGRGKEGEPGIIDTAEAAIKEATGAGLPTDNASTAVDEDKADPEAHKDDTPGFKVSPLMLGILAVGAIILLKSKK